MTTIELPKIPLKAASTNNLFLWWYHPWMEATDSSAKLRRIWQDTLNDAVRHELEFFSAMAISYSKLTHCMLGLGGLKTPTSMASCYREIADDMTEATWKRMRKVSELSDELRERIWCEI
ncbi:hypothetical protein R6258_13445 [Halomonas sp. HP20-15]|uniref:hypothetical protein n=1 Tax=Halomonas sp. HP20-15 TaxID=3085901 RepID=UPI002981664B|nr:hypothetical protein [Halomonas sp. HP20-15]MDW5377930.1 hypothetical protein [Halomonas sp. HP20-15]